MSTQTSFDERRFALRLALRLPVVASGRADDGATWSEPTETDDISTSGALLQLNQTVQPGDKLYIRSHRPDGMPVEVMAEVIRLSASNYGSARVGIKISEPLESWLRFFVSWVADDQPSTFQDAEQSFDNEEQSNHTLETA